MSSISNLGGRESLEVAVSRAIFVILNDIFEQQNDSVQSLLNLIQNAKEIIPQHQRVLDTKPAASIWFKNSLNEYQIPIQVKNVTFVGFSLFIVIMNYVNYIDDGDGSTFLANYPHLLLNMLKYKSACNYA